MPDPPSADGFPPARSRTARSSCPSPLSPMKNRIKHLLRSASPIVGAALYLSLVGGPASAQCGDDLYVNGARSSQAYGASAAIDGDWAVVGMTGHAGGLGAADIVRRINGEWVFHQRLTPSLAWGAAAFGSGVAISGDTVVVGARLDSPGNPYVYQSGAAYVFEKQGDAWVELAQLVASDYDTYDEFGCAVGIDGDVIVIGAHKDEATGGSYSGSAYVFQRTAGVWAEQRKIQPSGIAASWYFGSSVDIDGTSIAVGTRKSGQIGSAHVFTQFGPNWIEQGAVFAPFGGANSNFGYSVSIEGDLLAIGHTWATGPVSGVTAGLVHVYTRSGAIWSPAQILEPSGPVYNDYFGASLDFADSGTLAVGAYYDDTFATDAGAVLVFEEGGGTWTEVAQFGQCGATASEWMGGALAADGSSVFVGSTADDDMATNAGKVLALEEIGGTWYAEEELWAGANISLAAGGNAAIEMNFGVPNAGRLFLVGGTTSGTTPGLDVQGYHIPLNYDFYASRTLLAPNIPPLTNSFGFTDVDGKATCTFTIAAGTDPALAGLRVTHCAVLLLPLDYVSKTDDLLIVP